ncbi:hypothetical protein EW145_g3121 [Phellinidium pouzarii]|uniref:Uncharacterized protein n=1 Tax=Phellinidium pouzarii TaxID=167371 RepID=A0A4S4LDT5_9AGAM|nr:hypothetical protein EW145_g3121 [Phellinidium pouzarii]
MGLKGDAMILYIHKKFKGNENVERDYVASSDEETTPSSDGKERALDNSTYPHIPDLRTLEYVGDHALVTTESDTCDALILRLFTQCSILLDTSCVPPKHDVSIIVLRRSRIYSKYGPANEFEPDVSVFINGKLAAAVVSSPAPSMALYRKEHPLLVPPSEDERADAELEKWNLIGNGYTCTLLDEQFYKSPSTGRRYLFCGQRTIAVYVFRKNGFVVKSQLMNLVSLGAEGMPLPGPLPEMHEVDEAIAEGIHDIALLYGAPGDLFANHPSLSTGHDLLETWAR